MNIGLALSGGGFRAAVFHFGVLDRLARQGLLEEVSFVSTVSGGSLGMSLVFALNGMRWPTSQEYLRVIRSGARTKLTTLNLQISLIKRALTRLNLLQSRALDLAVLLRRHWNFDASLSDLPQHPRWIINTTCYETGKLWRFERKRMGDYLFGYSLVPEFPLDRAVAASAAYPGLIGPLEVNTAEWDWIQFGDRLTNGKHGTRPIKPKFEKVHLWDAEAYMTIWE